MHFIVKLHFIQLKPLYNIYSLSQYNSSSAGTRVLLSTFARSRLLCTEGHIPVPRFFSNSPAYLAMADLVHQLTLACSHFQTTLVSSTRRPFTKNHELYLSFAAAAKKALDKLDSRVDDVVAIHRRVHRQAVWQHHLLLAR